MHTKPSMWFFVWEWAVVLEELWAGEGEGSHKRAGERAIYAEVCLQWIDCKHSRHHGAIIQYKRSTTCPPITHIYVVCLKTTHLRTSPSPNYLHEPGVSPTHPYLAAMPYLLYSVRGRLPGVGRRPAIAAYRLGVAVHHGHIHFCSCIIDIDITINGIRLREYLIL